jgi:molybdopterin synthase catalytic subunit
LILITEDDFDINKVVDPLRSKRVGAIVTFIGIVRDFTQIPQDDDLKKTIQVKELIYESYDDMALEKMTDIRDHAKGKFNVYDMNLVHRKGRLKPSDNIVIIACSAAHRKEAFSACEYAIEELKKIVPIWKKEVSVDGEYWVGKREKVRENDKNG